MEKKTQTPDVKSAHYELMEPDWKMCSDLRKGTRHIRKQKETYLPRNHEEDSTDYDARLARSYLFPAFDFTIDGLAGIALRKGLLVSPDMEDQIVEWLENIDNAGTSIDRFVSNLLNNVLDLGFAYILVDYPKADPTIVTEADRVKANRRPYWVMYKADQLISYRLSNVNGQTVLSQAVLWEQVTMPDGTFGESLVNQYRVLRPGEFEIWREVTNDKGGTELIKIEEESGATGLSEIPLVPVAGKSDGLFTGTPPLLDLAFMNVEHYQKHSDRSYLLHKACIPLLTLIGFDEEEVKKMKVGPSTGIVSSNESASASYTEVQGHAFDASRQELKDIEHRMATLGLQMLAEKHDTEKTATEANINQNDKTSDLRNIIIGLNSSLKRALYYTRLWIGAKGEGTISVSTDFSALVMNPQVLGHLSAMASMKQISLKTMWSVLKQGEILPVDFDEELEQELINTESDTIAAEGALVE